MRGYFVWPLGTFPPFSNFHNPAAHWLLYRPECLLQLPLSLGQLLFAPDPCLGSSDWFISCRDSRATVHSGAVVDGVAELGGAVRDPVCRVFL